MQPQRITILKITIFFQFVIGVSTCLICFIYFIYICFSLIDSVYRCLGVRFMVRTLVLIGRLDCCSLRVVSSAPPKLGSPLSGTFSLCTCKLYFWKVTAVASVIKLFISVCQLLYLAQAAKREREGEREREGGGERERGRGRGRERNMNHNKSISPPFPSRHYCATRRCLFVS